jgi:hypothetical protein
VARTNPLGLIKDVALGTLLHPVGTAGKAVEQAKGTAAIGRLVAGQVARTAASAAAGTVSTVARRAGVSSADQHEAATPATARSTRGDEPMLRPVPTVNEPAHTSTPAARRGRKAASPESTKNHGDQLAPVTKAVKKAPAKKTPAKKAAEAPVARKAVETPPAPPVKKTAAKAPAKKAAKKAAGSDTDLTTKRTPPRKLAAQGLDDVTPADVAKVAKKTPTKKTTPVTPVTEPAAKKTARKTAKKAAAQTPTAATPDAPRTASEVANEEGPEFTTPVGTTAAGDSALPNTDLQQPGTEPLMDPATVKAVKSETETLQRAADPDKG